MSQYINSITFVNGLAEAISYQSIQVADLPASPVTPGSYTSANLTVDAYGRVTAAASGSGAGGGGVSAVQNTDGSLTITTAAGVVTAGLNAANANNWTGQQNFGSAVGIGTTDPQAALHVETTGFQSVTAIRLQCGSGGYAGFQLWDSNTGNSWAVGHQYGAPSGASLVFAYGDVGSEAVVSQIDYLGAWHPPSIGDGFAQSNSLYYSSTTGKLTYKDPSGTTHPLY